MAIYKGPKIFYYFKDRIIESLFAKKQCEYKLSPFRNATVIVIFQVAIRLNKKLYFYERGRIYST